MLLTFTATLDQCTAGGDYIQFHGDGALIRCTKPPHFNAMAPTFVENKENKENGTLIRC